MPIYNQVSGVVTQDLGFIYGEAGNIKEIDDFNVPVEIGGDSDATNCCSSSTGGSSTACCPSGIDLNLVGQTLFVTYSSNNGTTVTDSVLLPSGSVGVDTQISGLTLSVSGNSLTTTVVDTNTSVFTDTVALPTVNTTNCITGDGTTGSPVSLQIDPSGCLDCGPNGLTVAPDFLTINAGTTANPNDATGGSASVGCSGTSIVHFWSPNSTINVGVSPGSAIVAMDVSGIAEVSGLTLAVSGSVLTATVTDTLGGSYSDSATIPSAFQCSDLNTCSINSLSDVDISGAANGQILSVSGGQVVAINSPADNNTEISGLTLSVSGSSLTTTITDTNSVIFTDTVVLPSAFQCSDLNTCSINSLSDVDISGGTNGQVLTISGGQVVAQDPTSSNDCCPSGATLVASGQSLVFTYTANNGAAVTDTVVVPKTFECTDLGTCSINSLSDVNISGATNNQILSVSGGQVIAVNSPADNNTTISGLTVNVSGTTLTTTIVDSDATIFTDSAVIPSAFTCSDLNGCSVNELNDVDVSGGTTGQVLTISGGQVIAQDPAIQNDCCPSGITLGLTGQTLFINYRSNNGEVVADSVMLPSGTVNTDTQISGHTLTVSGTSLTSTITDTNTTVFTDTVALPKTFECTDLNTCSVNSLSDVDVSGATTGQVLSVSGGQVIASDPSTDCCPSGLTVTLSGQTLSVLLNTQGGVNVSDSVLLSDGDTQISGLTLTASGTSIVGTITDTNAAVFTSTVVVPKTFECVDLSGCSVNNLGDVNITAANQNDFLQFSGGNWINVPNPADLTLYTTDGILTGNRTVNGSGLNLTFSNISQTQFQSVGGAFFTINSNVTLDGGAITLTSPGGNYVIGDGTAATNPPDATGEFELLGRTTPDGIVQVVPSGAIGTTLIMGPSGVPSWQTSSATVSTSGCVTGDGSVGNPITLILDISGGLQCGPSGLRIAGDGCCDVNSYVNSNLPSGTPSSPIEPASNPVEGTVQEEVFNNGIIYWVHNGTSWQIDKVFEPAGADVSGISSVSASGCISGDGTTGSPLVINLDPSGNLECTAAGLRTVAPRSYSFEMGKAGTVGLDTSGINNQHKRPLSSKEQCTVYDSRMQVATVGNSDTTVQVYTFPSGGSPGTLQGTFTLPSGQESAELTSLIGTTLPVGGSIAEIVTNGSNATDLNIVVWVDCERL